MVTKFDYQGIKSDAHDLIVFFGMDAVLRRVGSPDRPCVAAFVEYRPREKDTQLVNLTDRYVALSALTPEIQAMPPDAEVDKLVTFKQPPMNPPIEDEVLPIIAPVKVTAPAGVPVLYEFTVRK